MSAAFHYQQVLKTTFYKFFWFLKVLTETVLDILLMKLYLHILAIPFLYFLVFITVIFHQLLSIMWSISLWLHKDLKIHYLNQQLFCSNQGYFLRLDTLDTLHCNWLLGKGGITKLLVRWRNHFFRFSTIKSGQNPSPLPPTHEILLFNLVYFSCSFMSMQWTMMLCH